MITKTTIFTRPNDQVPFPGNGSQELREYIGTAYTGCSPTKLLSKTQSVSIDNLQLTVVLTFSDQAAADQYTNDPLRASFIADRAAYASANGITITQF